MFRRFDLETRQYLCHITDFCGSRYFLLASITTSSQRRGLKFPPASLNGLPFRFGSNAMDRSIISSLAVYKNASCSMPKKSFLPSFFNNARYL